MEPAMQQTREWTETEVVVRPDTYATLLVHAEPGKDATHRVEVAAALARDLGARLIGLGAETFDPCPTPDPFTGYAAGEWAALILEQVTKELKGAEAAFRRDAAGADIEWRQAQAYPHEAIAEAARAADLIIASPRTRTDATRTADPADVVMAAGRPVLIVPPGRRQLRGMAVVVAWKNTRECRRAVADALPFLQRADDVIVLSVCGEAAAPAAKTELDDVVASLKRRGVEARAMVTGLDHLNTTRAIEEVADVSGADLIVAGAYGHSRLREWAFGGVTDDFMHRPACFVLMSH
jgi:nucleotide-binding universal stress UspA family protein